MTAFLILGPALVIVGVLLAVVSASTVSLVGGIILAASGLGLTLVAVKQRRE
jgi:hypothetical protein